MLISISLLSVNLISIILYYLMKPKINKKFNVLLPFFSKLNSYEQKELSNLSKVSIIPILIINIVGIGLFTDWSFYPFEGNNYLLESIFSSFLILFGFLTILVFLKVLALLGTITVIKDKEFKKLVVEINLSKNSFKEKESKEILEDINYFDELPSELIKEILKFCLMVRFFENYNGELSVGDLFRNQLSKINYLLYNSDKSHESEDVLHKEPNLELERIMEL